MTQALTILWQAPIPNPTCNYIAAYRAKGIPSYTFVNTSGSTSGTNSLNVPGLVPACYEGFIQSNCCGDSLSDLTNSYWGVNSWQPVYASATVNINARSFNFVVTSVYPNPYPTLCTLNINFNTSATTFVGSYPITYPANTTLYAITEFNGNVGAGSTINFVYITSIAPVFNNGGNLQQRDIVNTPQYFGFYNTSGCTSGSTSGCTSPTWSGSPILLPSFTQDGFNVTGTDTMGNPIAGQLLVSWIQSSTFGGGSGVYASITFQIFDSTGVHLQGTITVPYGVPGLNNASIPISSTIGTISISTQYLMKTLWADTSVSGSALFYLPTF